MSLFSLAISMIRAMNQMEGPATFGCDFNRTHTVAYKQVSNIISNTYPSHTTVVMVILVVTNQVLARVEKVRFLDGFE